MFRNFGYLIESRESPISVYEIPRTVFGESLGKPSFNVSGVDLLISMSINENLPETLKSHYKMTYREDHLMRAEYLCF